MSDPNELPSEPTPDTTQPTIEFLAKELARVSKERDRYKEWLAEVLAKFNAYQKEVGARDWQRVQAELAQAKDTCTHHQALSGSLTKALNETEEKLRHASDKLKSIRTLTNWVD